MVDAIVGGSLMKKTSDDAYQLLDDMANNAFNWQSERSIRKTAGNHSIDTLFALSTQMELLNKKMDNINIVSHHAHDMSYDLSEGDQDIQDQDYSFSE